MPVTFPNGDPRKQLRLLERAIVLGAQDAVEMACTLVKKQAVQNVTDLEKVDQGILRGSINYTISRDGLKGVVAVTAPYGKWVEFGRRGSITSPPGMTRDSATAAWPPVNVIRAWVLRNFKKLKPFGTTKSGRARRYSNTVAAERQLAAATFLIGRKIAEHGIAPAPFLRPAYKAVRPNFRGMVRDFILKRKAEIK